MNPMAKQVPVPFRAARRLGAARRQRPHGRGHDGLRPRCDGQPALERDLRDRRRGLRSDAGVAVRRDLGLAQPELVALAGRHRRAGAARPAAAPAGSAQLAPVHGLGRRVRVDDRPRRDSASRSTTCAAARASRARSTRTARSARAPRATTSRARPTRPTTRATTPRTTRSTSARRPRRTPPR